MKHEPIPEFLRRAAAADGFPVCDAKIREMAADLVEDIAEMKTSMAEVGDRRRTSPLDDLATLLSRLTYGEMIALTSAIIGHAEYKPATDPNELAAQLHRWAMEAQ